MACFGVNILLIYPLIRVLSPHPCFIPTSVFYPLIRVLYPHPCFILSSGFYPLIRVLSPRLRFIPPIRVLSPHPCFIPSSVFYSLIRVLSPHPCFIPLSVSVSVFYPNPFAICCRAPARQHTILDNACKQACHLRDVYIFENLDLCHSVGRSVGADVAFPGGKLLAKQGGSTKNRLTYAHSSAFDFHAVKLWSSAYTKTL